MGHMGNSNSLANLGKPWTKETRPGNGGRPKGYVSISNYLDSLSTTPIGALHEIYNDKRNPPFKIAAARQLLTMAGEIPGTRTGDVLASFSEVADRTEGKPKQVTELQHSIGDERPVVLDEKRWRESIEHAGDKRKALDTGAREIEGESSTKDDEG